MLRFAAVRDAVLPSIFADGSGFHGLYRPEKFTAGNGKRIKRADKEETMTLFPLSLPFVARAIPRIPLFLPEDNAAWATKEERSFPRVDSLNRGGGGSGPVPPRKVD